MADEPQVTVVDRWSNWTLLGPDNDRTAPTIRLVHAVRLWRDDVALDRTRCGMAWSRLLERLQTTGGGGLWELEESTDSSIHELAPAPKRLFQNPDGMRLWRMSKQGLVKSGFPPQGRIAWSLCAGRGKHARRVPVGITGIALWASGDGLGYLVVNLELRSTATAPMPSVADFLDALHHVRFLRSGDSIFEGEARVDPTKSVQPPARVRIGDSPLGAEWRPSDQPGVHQTSFHIKDLCMALFQQLAGEDSDPFDSSALENGETLRAYVFANLRPTSPEATSDQHELLLQIAEMARSSREIARSLRDDGPGSGISHYEYSQDAFFLFSHECTAFIVFGQASKEFWQRTMPHHVLNEYFAIQILTMFQRHIVDEVRRLAGEHSPDDREASAEISDTRWQQLAARARDAKARGYFVEVSVRTNHARFESKLREVLKVDRAYDLSMGLIDGLCESQIARVEMRRERESERRERFWQLVAGCAVLPTVALTVMNVNMPGLTTADEGLRLSTVIGWTLGCAVVGFLIALARDRRPSRPKDSR